MFSKVAIVGVGLLGGSLARDLKNKNLATSVIGVCRSESTKRFAIDNQVVDEVLPLERACQQADLIVLATPMQTMTALLSDLAKVPDIESKTITDVGSVKGSLLAEINQRCPQLLKNFVLGHPIAGGERAGIQSSKLDLFSNKDLILIEGTGVDRDRFAQVQRLWSTLGSNVIVMEAQQHDSIFAHTSHLPHAVAFALSKCLANEENAEELFGLAAAGFYDFTRIASSDAQMWRDIFVQNRTQVLSALLKFRGQVDDLLALIESGDQSTLLEFLAEAKQARDHGLTKKLKSK